MSDERSTGHVQVEVGQDCPCGFPWMRHYWNGALLRIECTRGHQPWHWLKESDVGPSRRA